MTKKELQASARQTTMSPKSERDHTDSRQMLTVEAVANAELDEHLGHE